MRTWLYFNGMDVWGFGKIATLRNLSSILWVILSSSGGSSTWFNSGVAALELLKLGWLRIWPGVPGHLRGQQILGLQTPPWIGQWQNLALRRLHKRTQFSPCYSWCVVCTVSHNGLFVPGGRILVFGKMIILIVYLVANNSFGKKIILIVYLFTRWQNNSKTKKN